MTEKSVSIVNLTFTEQVVVRSRVASDHKPPRGYKRFKVAVGVDIDTTSKNLDALQYVKYLKSRFVKV